MYFRYFFIRCLITKITLNQMYVWIRCVTAYRLPKHKRVCIWCDKIIVCSSFSHPFGRFAAILKEIENKRLLLFLVLKVYYAIRDHLISHFRALIVPVRVIHSWHKRTTPAAERQTVTDLSGVCARVFDFISCLSREHFLGGKFL